MKKIEVLKIHLFETLDEIETNIELEGLNEVAKAVYRDQLQSTIIALSLVESIINEEDPLTLNDLTVKG